MPYQFKVPVVEQPADVALAAGKEIVKADHVISKFKEPFAKM